MSGKISNTNITLVETESYDDMEQTGKTSFYYNGIYAGTLEATYHPMMPETFNDENGCKKALFGIISESLSLFVENNVQLTEYDVEIIEEWDKRVIKLDGHTLCHLYAKKLVGADCFTLPVYMNMIASHAEWEIDNQ